MTQMFYFDYYLAPSPSTAETQLQVRTRLRTSPSQNKTKNLLQIQVRTRQNNSQLPVRTSSRTYDNSQPELVPENVTTPSYN